MGMQNESAFSLFEFVIALGVFLPLGYVIFCLANLSLLRHELQYEIASQVLRLKIPVFIDSSTNSSQAGVKIKHETFAVKLRLFEEELHARLSSVAEKYQCQVVTKIKTSSVKDGDGMVTYFPQSTHSLVEEGVRTRMHIEANIIPVIQLMRALQAYLRGYFVVSLNSELRREF